MVNTKPSAQLLEMMKNHRTVAPSKDRRTTAPPDFILDYQREMATSTSSASTLTSGDQRSSPTSFKRPSTDTPDGHRHKRRPIEQQHSSTAGGSHDSVDDVVLGDVFGRRSRFKITYRGKGVAGAGQPKK